MEIETLGQTLIPIINKLQDLFSQVRAFFRWAFSLPPSTASLRSFIRPLLRNAGEL
jgi:hypothetical protein